MAQWLVAKILPKAVPLPRGSYSTMDGDKPSKPMNWDIPPAGVESGLEAAKADWAQRVSSRMASSGMAPSSRFPSSTGVPRSRDVSLESRRVEGSLQSVPQTRETSTERR
ncbi:hypothetical protein DACRYDRAFT_24166 [Dacryopinax primogenitus]|uniref:Uncharacterized protein n=1 Tax=Dacryopinax primogenitus (strain DJM 731) TaxID=1858805 RepID=M5G5S7_DACPD|nr:uncharacterized protein DACRYDRAFT_24166 [Dacryopinax primogenitus]EJT99112.1 hypothetical protein DACRYDRAFT_24166 [Dacryopinax primogenitus]